MSIVIVAAAGGPTEGIPIDWLVGTRWHKLVGFAGFLVTFAACIAAASLCILEVHRSSGSSSSDLFTVAS